MIVRMFVAAFASLFLFISVPANAEWEISRVVYHDYCPPIAWKLRLCSFGGPFDSADLDTMYDEAGDQYPPPQELGYFVLNTLRIENGVLMAGSRVKFLYPWRDRERYFSYDMVENLTAADGMPFTECDLRSQATVPVTTYIGRETMLEIDGEPTGCEVSLRSEWTETANYGESPIRDATLYFNNTDCQDL